MRVGSLFSGYGGLDLAVEHVFGAETVWFSEINEPVARVFAHHWTDAPNLGDITSINWHDVPSVDILCGGFPCQDVSTVGKRAGLAPGTRSGLWAQMATAIEILQPQFVVIENVRGLLSTKAIRPTQQGASPDARNPNDATGTDATAALRDLEPDPWGLGDQPARPLRALGAVLGDLADLRYDARWLGIPASLVGAPHPRFRIFVLARRAVPNPSGLGLGQGWGDARSGESAPRDDRSQPSGDRPDDPAWSAPDIGHNVRADRGVLRRWGRYAPAISRWERIIGRPAPSPAILNQAGVWRPAPDFVEWLMGLPDGWVTAPHLGLTSAQQLAALGNGVAPRQASIALQTLLRCEGQPSVHCHSGTSAN
ncbi:Modification methylase HhaI [Microbacterium ginsengisoli]|uniref:DNA (cytosine-5-)-methyltransferase n=2 Tax=Actinomycetota TaxID=201174 RepID=A0A0F0LTH7_9MICO|nr:Modification methylase HhaI [Microbacterium ginsengisoli]